MRNKAAYYFGSTFRRREIDALQKKYSSEYKGVVLDIGGRDRGAFKKPKGKVEKWIFADIEKKHHPDIVTDVSNMHMIEAKSVDVVNAMELFEHVEKIEEGISECYRILKKGGKLMISVPFLFPVHADPYDFQRWTITKWENVLKSYGFTIEKAEITGRFFTVLGDMNKTLVKSMPFGIRHIGYLSFPFFDLLKEFDKKAFIKNHSKLGKYHGGYFIIAKK